MMTAATPTSRLSDVPSQSPSQPGRVTSVDALRGLVMFTMLFVNDVAGVNGVPGWMQHIHPPTADGMTFVDLVFPAFLFLVGMAIPLSLRGRIARGEPAWKLAGHVLTRALSLLLIGILMVNMPASAKLMGWRGHLWEVLTFTAVLLAFHSVPRPTPLARRASLAVRIVGFAGIAYLAWVYKGRNGGHLQTSWYGILGLIGWAYLIATLCYLPFRRWRVALLALTALLLYVWILDRQGAFDGSPLLSWIDGGKFGSLPSISLAGAALATTFVGPTALAPRRRFAFAAFLIAACAVAAVLLRPAFQINKNAATPSWCLWAIAITTALWLIFHATLDLRPAATRRLSAPVSHAGGNALLAYILAALIAHLLALSGAHFYNRLGSGGLAVGITRSLVFAAIVLAISALLSRARVHLKV